MNYRDGVTQAMDEFDKSQVCDHPRPRGEQGCLHPLAFLEEALPAQRGYPLPTPSHILLTRSWLPGLECHGEGRPLNHSLPKLPALTPPGHSAQWFPAEGGRIWQHQLACLLSFCSEIPSVPWERGCPEHTGPATLSTEARA